MPAKFTWRAAIPLLTAALIGLAACQAEPATPEDLPATQQTEGADLTGSPGGLPDGTGAGNATRSSGTGTGLSGSGLMSDPE